MRPASSNHPDGGRWQALAQPAGRSVPARPSLRGGLPDLCRLLPLRVLWDSKDHMRRIGEKERIIAALLGVCQHDWDQGEKQAKKHRNFVDVQNVEEIMEA